MDVVCDRCKTEYEFDDALVSERGTTVKCTNCGHQFKIFRAAAEAEVGRVWNLRRPDGTVIPFDSLAVLQKWILEGRVSKMDEIARPGDPWKSLGAIAELESFFSTAEARSQPPIPSRGVPRTPSAGRSLPPLHRGPTPPSGTSVAGRSVPARVPAPPASTGNTVRSAAPPPANGPKVTAPLPRAPGGTTPGFPLPKPPAVPSELAPRVVAHEPPAVPAPPIPAPEPREVDHRAKPSAADVPGLRDAPAPAPARDLAARDDDAPTTTMTADDFATAAAPRRGGLLAGLAIGLVLAGVAGVAVWKSGTFGERAPAPTTTAAPPRVRGEDLAAATNLARAYTATSFEDAREALTRLLGANPRDGAVLAARAEVLAAWAEMERDHASDLERRAALVPDGAAMRAEAAVLRRDSAQRIERARADLTAVRAVIAEVDEAKRADVEAALLDAARVVGVREDAQRYGALVRARAERPAGHDVALAMLARDEGDTAAAVTSLQAAIARQEDPRARVALARLLLARGDASGARAQVDAVLARGAGHDDASALAALIGGADAGVAAVAPVAVAPVVDAGAVARAATPPPAAGTAVPRDYDRLVAEGDRLQNDGRTALAEERFRAALAVRPNGAEALTGMGYVEIDRRNYGGAVSRFRQALQSNGHYSDAYIGLGEAYASQSRYEQALEAYNRYVEVNPGGSRASMARRQIESLQDRVRHAHEEPAPSPPAGGNGESGRE